MRFYPVILSSTMESSASSLTDQFGLDSSEVELQWSKDLTLDEHPEDVSQTAYVAAA